MKLLFVLLLGILGFTADAAFSAGVMGATMNLTHAQPNAGLSLGITADLFFIVILLVSIIFRVRHLVQEAVRRTQVAERRARVTQ